MVLKTEYQLIVSTIEEETGVEIDRMPSINFSYYPSDNEISEAIQSKSGEVARVIKRYFPSDA